MRIRDSEVVASIVAGDPEGLAAAYDRYADPLYKYCRTLLHDPADAAGAVQDTFVIAASRLGRLREPERLRAWLYAVARNEAWRIRGCDQPTPAPDEAPVVNGNAAGASEVAEHGDLRELLDSAADGLGPAEREVIELRLRQGLEPAEVARVLGVSRSHAHALLSRARDQLEVCLAVLLIGRAGRADCAELGAMLAGWDGRLTVLLRMRLHQHLGNCAACSARRAIELRPAMLLRLSPGAALAAGAAASFRLAAGAPAGLRAHTLALATGQGTDAAAHRAAVLARAGAFSRSGFPRPFSAAGTAGLAARHAVPGGVLGPLRSSPQAQTAMAAAVALAVLITAVAFALTASGQSARPAADPKPPGTVRALASASPTGPASAAVRPAGTPTTATPTTATPTGTAAALAPTASTPATATSAPGPGPTTASPSPTASASSPSPTGPASSPTASPTAPGTSPAPSPSPSPTATSPLTVLPAGGPLIVWPNGRAIVLQAVGGTTVAWSATVSDNPGNAVGLSQSSGTLTAASAATVVLVTSSQFVSCLSSSYPTITISPGGTHFTVCTGFTNPATSHSRQHRRAGSAAPTAPASAGLAISPARRRDL